MDFVQIANIEEENSSVSFIYRQQSTLNNRRRRYSIRKILKTYALYWVRKKIGAHDAYEYLDDSTVYEIRNQGGFYMIGLERTKIEPPE